MAFGFPASHIQYIPYNHLTRQEFLYYSIKACQELNWNVTEINDSEIIAETVPEQETWNEKIVINFENEDGYIYSASKGNQIYDQGRNLKNTDLFFEVFNNIKKEHPTYCQLRIKLYRTAYLKIKYNSNAYDEELANLNNQIIEILNNIDKDKKE